MEPRDLYLRSICKKPEIHGLNSYVAHLPLVQWLDTLEFHQPVTFLVGENGSGKSTLLEAVALALGLQPGGGLPELRLFHPGHPLRAAQLPAAAPGPLPPQGRLFPAGGELLQRLQRGGQAGQLPARDGLYQSYGGNSLHQSHGESFLTLMHNRFGGQGIYLLDSPRPPFPPPAS